MNYFVLCFILKWLNYSNWLPNIKNEPLKSSSVCGLWKHLRDDLFPFIGLTYYRALIMKQLKKMFRSVTTQALRPEALNHCTHGLLLQKPWFDVYNFPLLSSLPQPTGIHVRTFSAPSVLTSDAPQHQSLCSALAAPRKPLVPPSFPPSSSSQPLSRILLRPFMPNWDAWVKRFCRGGETKTKKRRLYWNKSEGERTGTLLITSNAGHCRPDQEGELLEQLEGPGYRYLSCDLLRICLVPACRFHACFLFMCGKAFVSIACSY